MLFSSPWLGQILVLLADMAALMENYNVFHRTLRFCDSALLSSRASMLPLIATSREIRAKQVNYFFWSQAKRSQQQRQPVNVSVWLHDTCSDLSDGDNYGCPLAPWAAVRPVWASTQLSGAR